MAEKQRGGKAAEAERAAARPAPAEPAGCGCGGKAPRPDKAAGGAGAHKLAGPAGKSGQERRDFLTSAAAIMGAFGLGAVIWPFIKQLRPDKAAQSEASLQVDIAAIQPGEQILVEWQGKPVIIRNRAAAEVAAARAANPAALEDRLARNANLPAQTAADDLARSGGAGHENWLVFINICTHLGCPTKAVAGGWFCPCHGSRYDAAARVIQGPANRNMAIPPYRFLSDKLIEIG